MINELPIRKKEVCQKCVYFDMKEYEKENWRDNYSCRTANHFAWYFAEVFWVTPVPESCPFILEATVLGQTTSDKTS